MEQAAAADVSADAAEFPVFDLEAEWGTITDKLPSTGQLSPYYREGEADSYKISIRSMAEFDAALDAAAAAGLKVRLIHAAVLPTISFVDCDTLEEAMRAGSYRGIPLNLAAGIAVVRAKLEERTAASMGVKGILLAARAVLCSPKPVLTTPIEQGTGACWLSTPQSREMGAEEWARDVEGARQDTLDKLCAIDIQLGTI